MITSTCLSLVLISTLQACKVPASPQVKYPLTGATVQRVLEWNRHAQALGARVADLDRVDISVLGEDGLVRNVSLGRSKRAASFLRDSLSHLAELDDLFLGEPDIFTNNLKCNFVFRKHGKHSAETWMWRVFWVVQPNGKARLNPNRAGFGPLFQRLIHLTPELAGTPLELLPKNAKRP